MIIWSCVTDLSCLPDSGPFDDAANDTSGDSPSVGENTFVTNVRRIVLRSAFAQASYPISRFRRVEIGVEATHLDDGIRQFREPYEPFSGIQTRDVQTSLIDLPGADYIRPSTALTSRS